MEETFSDMLERKLYDMMDYAYGTLTQFPKSEKFAMAADIKHSMNLIVHLCEEGLKKFYKKTTLQQLDIEIATLRFYIRLSHKRGWISNRRYDKWSDMVDEIGKITGAWIKKQLKG